MSWSIVTTARDAAELIDKLPEFRESVVRQNPDGVEQANMAVAVVCLLLGNSALGTAPAWYISMSGHANPGHVRREGWANDAITISVAQRHE